MAGLAAFSLASVQAGESTVEVRIHGYRELLNPAALAPAEEVYAVPYPQAEGAPSQPATHLVVVGVAPEEGDFTAPGTDRDLYFGDYRAMNRATGDILEEGQIVLRMPSFPENSGSSAVVGVFKYAALPSQAPAAALGGLLADGVGTLFSPSAQTTKTVEVEFPLGNGERVDNETRMTINDKDTVSLDGFGHDPEKRSPFQFDRVALSREGNDYRGKLRRTDEEEPGTWWDRRAVLTVTDRNDADLDGVPDFSDPELSYVPWFAQRHLIGNWYFSDWMQSYVYSAHPLWTYTTALGWIYAPEQSLDGLWLYSASPDLKWVWTSAELYPYLYRQSTGQFGYLSRDDAGQAYLYNYQTQSWETVRFE